MRRIAYPVFYLQRHALELVLKQTIGVLMYHRHITLERRWAGSEPPRHHDLARLLARLERLMCLAKDLADLSVLRRLVRKFHQMDRTSTWSRYRTHSRRRVLDLLRTQDDLEAIFDQLLVYPEDAEGRCGLMADYLLEIQGELTARLNRGEL